MNGLVLAAETPDEFYGCLLCQLPTDIDIDNIDTQIVINRWRNCNRVRSS